MECIGCILKYRFGGCAAKSAVERAITVDDPEVAIKFVRLTYQDTCPRIEKLIETAGYGEQK